MKKSSLTIRKEVALPAALFACIALGLWAGNKNNQNLGKHASVDSELVTVSALASQAQQLRANTEQDAALQPISQMAVEQGFGSTAKLHMQGDAAMVQVVAIPASTYLSGIENLLVQSKAAVSASKVTLNNGVVTGTIEFALPVAP